MDPFVTDDQQVEALKKWWKENGKSVITGLVLGLAIIVGVRTWFDYRAGREQAASLEYQRMESALEKQDTATAQQLAAHLITEYHDTVYGVMAALEAARLQMDKGDAKAAQAHLEWALEQVDEPSLRDIARLRLAQVLLQEGETDRALKLVDSQVPESFRAEFQELKGDIELARGDRAAARSAYESAQALVGPDSPRSAWLRMKLEDIAGQADHT